MLNIIFKKQHPESSSLSLESETLNLKAWGCRFMTRTSEDMQDKLTPRFRSSERKEQIDHILGKSMNILCSMNLRFFLFTKKSELKKEGKLLQEQTKVAIWTLRNKKIIECKTHKRYARQGSIVAYKGLIRPEIRI